MAIGRSEISVEEGSDVTICFEVTNAGDQTLTDGRGAFVFNAVPGGDLTIAADGTASGAMRFKGTVNFDALLIAPWTICAP